MAGRPGSGPVSIDSLTRVALSEAQADALRATALHRTRFAVGPVVAELAFTSRASHDAFVYRHADAGVHDAPVLALHVAQTPNAAYLWSEPSNAYAWHGEALSPEALAFFADGVALREIVAATGVIAVHAAVVAGTRRVAALVGVSTAGKSTTAAACVRRGLRFYSDERCIVADGQVFPFLRALTLRAGARRSLLPEPPNAGSTASRELWLSDSDVVVRPGEIFDAALIGGPPRTLGALIFLRGFSDRASIEPTSLRDALPELLASTDVREHGFERVVRVLRAFDGIPCYSLRVGPADETAEAVAGLANA